MYQNQAPRRGFLQPLHSVVFKKIWLLILIFPQIVFANFSTVRNPRTFPLNYSSLSIKALAFSCLAMSDIPDDVPCQPAFVRLEKKPKFAINGAISNGYQALAKARRVLSNDLDADLMSSLFNEDKIIEVETNPSLYFTSSYVSGKYLLYGLQYYSTQRNQANPELQVFAADSKQLILQTGYNFQNWLLMGVQLRSQQDKIVNKSFRLVDLGTDNGKDLLKPHEYSRLFVEPGAAVLVENWKFSVFGSGLQVAGDQDEAQIGDLPDVPELQGGVSVQFPISVAVMDLDLDYKSLSYEESEDQKLHLGARIRYGALSLLSGVDSFGLSGGMLFSVEKIYSGILYSTSQVPWRKSEEYAQTVYIELGWQL